MKYYQKPLNQSSHPMVDKYISEINKKAQIPSNQKVIKDLLKVQDSAPETIDMSNFVNMLQRNIALDMAGGFDSDLEVTLHPIAYNSLMTTETGLGRLNSAYSAASEIHYYGQNGRISIKCGI